MASSSKMKNRHLTPSPNKRKMKTRISVVELDHHQHHHPPNMYNYVISDGTVVQVLPRTAQAETIMDGEEIHINEDGTYVDSQGQPIEIHEEIHEEPSIHINPELIESDGHELVLETPDTLALNHQYHFLTETAGNTVVKQEIVDPSHNSEPTTEEPSVFPVPKSRLTRVLPPPPRIKNKDIMTLPFTYAGQSFTVQAQKLILNVYNFFKTHTQDPFILHRLGTPQEQAGKILNVSTSVVGKIRNRFQNLGKIVVPGQNRKKVKRVLDNVTKEQEQVLRDIVQELSIKNVLPTVPLLLVHARKRINFVGSRTSFRRVLERMGFKYVKVNKKTIVVDPNQRHTLSNSD